MRCSKSGWAQPKTRRNSYGAWLLLLRKEKRLAQEAVAKQSGIPPDDLDVLGTEREHHWPQAHLETGKNLRRFRPKAAAR